MARQTDRIPGAPCWIDLSTSDVARSREFYTQLLGWTAEEPNEQFGGYFSFLKDGRRMAGCMGKMPGDESPSAWNVYLKVTDARATLDTAAARGGQVVVGAMDVADLGVMGGVVDPGGAFVGTWQPGTHPGSALLYGYGVPTWFELHTHAYDETLAFYRDVFGWTTTEMPTPGFRYSILQHDGEQLAGVMDDASVGIPAGPARWIVYFGVEDAEAACASATELGATVERQPEDTPYGRLASIVDPTGVRFNFMAPNAAMPFTSRETEGAASR